jgi:PIN domain nuclease of toxin-antitoxin system
MASVVADTHAALWHLGRDARLSTVARDALRESIQAGDPIFVASISVVEITYLVEKGRLPESALQTLRVALADPTFGLVPVALDLRVADAIRRISRDSVPDLPDRVIAATVAVAEAPSGHSRWEDSSGGYSDDLVGQACSNAENRRYGVVVRQPPSGLGNNFRFELGFHGVCAGFPFTLRGMP